MTCAQCMGIERQFDDAFARRDLKRYRRRGPPKTTRWLLDAITDTGARGRTFLDVGGGIGAIALDLMNRGAAGGTHVDASPAYLTVARAEAEARGHGDHIRHLQGDFVELASGLAPADLVTLDRVVCCYPDMEALVDASAPLATRVLGIVLPRDTRLMRITVRVINLVQRIRRNPFRLFLHPPADVEARVERHGLQRRFRRHSLLWQVLVFTRPERDRSAGG